MRSDAEVVRLSVREWRADAIALYSKLGFTQTASWEDRAQRLCMVLPVRA